MYFLTENSYISIKISLTLGVGGWGWLKWRRFGGGTGRGWGCWWWSQYKNAIRLTSICISIIKISRSHDDLIFIIEITIYIYMYIYEIGLYTGMDPRVTCWILTPYFSLQMTSCLNSLAFLAALLNLVVTTNADTWVLYMWFSAPVLSQRLSLTRQYDGNLYIGRAGSLGWKNVTTLLFMCSPIHEQNPINAIQTLKSCLNAVILFSNKSHPIARPWGCNVDCFIISKHSPYSAFPMNYENMMTSSNGNISASPVDSPHKGQWRGALMFSLIEAWTNGWANNRDVGDLRRHRAHYYVTVMRHQQSSSSNGCQGPLY